LVKIPIKLEIKDITDTDRSASYLDPYLEIDIHVFTDNTYRTALGYYTKEHE